MATDIYGFEDDEPRAQGKEHLFLWTVFILLLLGLAFACWLGSFYIFGHPELPRPYAILLKLKKIELPIRFEITKVPTGEFLTPKMLFERYSKYQGLQLDAINAELMRNFIKNYKEVKGLVPYVSGRFEIVDTYQLKPTDLFPTGAVAVAVANDYSQVVIEHVFTTGAESAESVRPNLPVGLDMRLEKTRDPVAIIHVEWTDDGRLVFTAMPLLYGTWGVKGSVGSFSLEPPQSMNLKAKAPIVKGAEFGDMMTRYAASRRSRPAPGDAEGAPARAEPELVRVDASRPGVAVPETGAIPQMQVATPIPGPTPILVASNVTPKGRGQATPAMRSTPLPKSTPVLAMLTTPAPLPTPPLVAPPRPPSGVIKPFVGSDSLTEGGNWRVYTRGSQPAGRSITSSEARKLAEQGGEVIEHLYLRGDFVVTVSGENRAILRAPAVAGEESKDGLSTVRIMVEFPPSVDLPAPGSTISRDDKAGFEVKGIRRGADGTINISAREITRG